MKRIAIIGCGGAGKTTFALELGRMLGIEVFHLDALHWKPGWVAPPREEWRETQERLVERDSWIIDGNYGADLDIRCARADTIILLDFPRRICLWRAVKRWLTHRGKSRPDMGPGCPEAIDWEFIKWIWNFNKLSRPKVIQRLNEHFTGRLITLCSPNEARRFLAAVSAPSHEGKPIL